MITTCGQRPLVVAAVVLSLVAAIGCAPRGRIGPAIGESGVEQDESFDPLALGIEELPIPQAVTAEGRRDTSRSAAQEASPRVGPADEMVPGYRVQLCATPDETEARAHYHEALLKFPDQGVYLQFDGPYYKVRVGDCRSRFEAEELQKRVRESGFPDAWVVRTRVYTAPPGLKENEEQQRD
ncbi:MAG: SPOR domain-containing protein [candidate division KSB1 bacterium]|nr:SPOR domain-containing protein [candidate division KSB1 bacterium]